MSSGFPGFPSLHVDDEAGQGEPLLFQHGLGGDAMQTREAFPRGTAFRRVTIEMPGHGRSEVGDMAQFSIARFTNAAAAWIGSSGAAPLVVGGISMGAAMALRLAVTRPELVKGLILARPAWLFEAAPHNMLPNAEVGRLLAQFPQAEALERFMASTTAQRLQVEAPDNLASLKGFFARQPQGVMAALLQSISNDGPGVSAEEAGALRIPVLIIAHGHDVIHPLSHAHSLHAAIPGSRLVEITAKTVDKQRYINDFQSAVQSFLEEF